MAKTIIEKNVIDVCDYCIEIGLSDHNCSVEQLDSILAKTTGDTLWNYPIDEIEHLIEIGDVHIVLVRFPDIYGGYEYRWCELGKVELLDEDVDDMEYGDFITDIEKMRDFFEISKEEFLFSYSYLKEEEYDLTAEKIRDMTAEEVKRIKEQCKALPDYD